MGTKDLRQSDKSIEFSKTFAIMSSILDIFKGFSLNKPVQVSKLSTIAGKTGIEIVQEPFIDNSNLK